MVPCVIVVRDNLLEENILCRDEEHAKQVFLDKLAEYVSNWGDYTPDDIDEIIDDGYEKFGHGSVCLSWATSPDEDEDKMLFRNYYRCACNTEWTDDWSCQCNDACPNCGTKDIQPYKSVDLDKDGNEIEGESK